MLVGIILILGVILLTGYQFVKLLRNEATDPVQLDLDLKGGAMNVRQSEPHESTNLQDVGDWDWNWNE